MDRNVIRDIPRQIVSWYGLTVQKGITLVVVIFALAVTLFLVNVAANISSFWSPMKAYNYALQDVGNDFFNKGFQTNSNYNEVVDIIMICFLAVTGVCIVINKLAIFIGLKLMVTIIISYLLRCTTLMVTGLPDSWDLGLRTISNTFSDLSRERGGDLIYSGHTLLVCAFAHCWSSFYLLSDSFSVHVITALCAWIVFGTIVTFIIVGRLHYTIDVLLALYITSGIWWGLDYFLIKYFEMPVFNLKFRRERLPPMIGGMQIENTHMEETPTIVVH
ncbi:shingomyelin synthase [Nematocida ausubeli]|nr:shingomyelin synthase [Nematocida ausubeli]KAI5135267.1 shingomyelin synthase [Nematocida ausubeli]KAI5148123.1 shingomyelin synthase [Nematocida ausubeli]